MSNLNIWFLNCSRISAKIQKLEILIKQNNINVILLGETRLHPPKQLKSQNFTFFAKIGQLGQESRLVESQPFSFINQ